MDQTVLDRNIATMRAMIAQLEERVSLLEQRLAPDRGSSPDNAPVAAEPASEPNASAGEELEYQVGQTWFAKAGIVVFAIGVVLLLTFPFQGVPPFLPSVVGIVLVAALFYLSRFWASTFPLLARYLFGAGMALLYFSVLRLCYFSAAPAISASSPAGIVLLITSTVINITLAIRRQSHYLLALALTCFAATALLSGSTLIAAVLLPLLAVFTSVARNRYPHQGLFFYGLTLTYASSYLLVMNNPLLARPIQLIASPVEGAALVLPCVAAFGCGTLFRREHRPEDWTQGAEAFANVALGYILVAWISRSADTGPFLAIHLLSSLLMIGLAVACWTRERSVISTFMYAMAGYFALSVAIIKASTSPDLFVWLALQSIVVVGTAVWFRSRFIVVANFFIYLSIIIGYLVATKDESGVILGFGVVALVSARILNWKKHRLALKTEAMRNAYLGIAFLVFPYAAYFLVPRQFVSLSWIAIAGLYYALNLVIKSPKYRWMGHLTLILTVLYVLIVGIIQLEPGLRIVSFLALAVALLAVSMVFTRARARKSAAMAKTDGR